MFRLKLDVSTGLDLSLVLQTALFGTQQNRVRLPGALEVAVKVVEALRGWSGRGAKVKTEGLGLDLGGGANRQEKRAGVNT